MAVYLTVGVLIACFRRKRIHNPKSARTLLKDSWHGLMRTLKVIKALKATVYICKGYGTNRAVCYETPFCPVLGVGRAKWKRPQTANQAEGISIARKLW